MKSNYFIIFFGLVLVDIIYVFYLKHVSNNDIHKASMWASLIVLCNGVVIVNYDYDVLSFISAMAGAYVGTHVSMRYFVK
jgi:hypothetical protein